jgi:hypothetical protein
MRWKKNVIIVKKGKFFINYSFCSVHFEKHTCLDNDLITEIQQTDENLEINEDINMYVNSKLTNWGY